MCVTSSSDTADLAVDALCDWWRRSQPHYPQAKRLLIEADSGGSNAARSRRYKKRLQDFADESGLEITVSHYPPGTSKWNPIEHRMFSVISGNWAGEPLGSYETVLKYIRTARTESGFRCRACLDRTNYPARQRVAAKDKARVRLKPHPVLPKWNYTILPHRPHGNR